MRAVSVAGLDLPTLHLDATGGLFYGTGASLELVRPGLCLYGELPSGGAGATFSERGAAAAAQLRPAMTLKARPLRIVDVPQGTPVGYGGLWTAPRPSRVATLPVGYGDGYVRTYQPGARGPGPRHPRPTRGQHRHGRRGGGRDRRARRRRHR